MKKMVKTACPRDCYGGCTMNVHVEDGRLVKVEGAKENKGTAGIICAKGLALKEYVYSPNRLKYPLIRSGKRGEGEFRRISWDTAVEKLCQELNKVRNESGPLGLMLYTHGGCKGMLSDYHKGFFRQFGGYSMKKGDLCCSAGSEAVKLTYGEVRHNAPWDIINSGLIILWGKNSANTNIQEVKHINDARAKGTRLITIDPIKNAVSAKSDIHISPKPGTDMALALCILNALIQRDKIDHSFVENYTFGFEALREHTAKYTIEYSSRLCEISRQEIMSTIEMIEANKPLTIICGAGIQRYKNGGQTVRALSMIPAITGDVGVKGGGFRFMNDPWPNLTWPFLPEKDYIIRDKYPAAFLAEALEYYREPEISMLWVERANPFVMHPDVNRLKAAAEKLDCIVVIEQFMTDTAKYADIVLPAQSYLEYTDIFTAASPYLNCFQKAIEPYYESKNESEIYRMLGECMGYDMRYLPEYNDDTINIMLQKSGIGVDIGKLKEGPYMEDHMEVAFSDRKFMTPSGKIELYSEEAVRKWGESPMPDFYSTTAEVVNELYSLRFLSTHPKERLHSQHADIQHLSTGKALLYMNSKDAEDRGIADGDKVEAFNDKGHICAYASVSDSIKAGVVNVFEGLSEHTGANVNMLTSQGVSDMGWGATYYDCFVEVRKALS